MSHQTLNFPMHLWSTTFGCKYCWVTHWHKSMAFRWLQTAPDSLRRYWNGWYRKIVVLVRPNLTVYQWKIGPFMLWIWDRFLKHASCLSNPFWERQHSQMYVKWTHCRNVFMQTLKILIILLCLFSSNFTTTDMRIWSIVLANSAFQKNMADKMDQSIMKNH